MKILKEIKQAWAIAQQTIESNSIIIPENRYQEFMDSISLQISDEFKTNAIIKCYGCTVIFANVDKILVGWLN